MLEPTCRAKCVKDVNELYEKRQKRATVSEKSEKNEKSEKRLSWRLATVTPEGVSEKRAREAQECEVRAQEARECENNEKRAREARKTLMEECEREKRAQEARARQGKEVVVVRKNAGFLTNCREMRDELAIVCNKSHSHGSLLSQSCAGRTTVDPPKQVEAILRGLRKALEQSVNAIDIAERWTDSRRRVPSCQGGV